MGCIQVYKERIVRPATVSTWRRTKFNAVLAAEDKRERIVCMAVNTRFAYHVERPGEML